MKNNIIRESSKESHRCCDNTHTHSSEAYAFHRTDVLLLRIDGGPENSSKTFYAVLDQLAKNKVFKRIEVLGHTHTLFGDPAGERRWSLLNNGN